MAMPLYDTMLLWLTLIVGILCILYVLIQAAIKMGKSHFK
jgi:hypothetical protein